MIKHYKQFFSFFKKKLNLNALRSSKKVIKFKLSKNLLIICFEIQPGLKINNITKNLLRAVRNHLTSKL
jgi:hypothetical protein